jgi:hypothetical protein
MAALAVKKRQAWLIEDGLIAMAIVGERASPIILLSVFDNLFHGAVEIDSDPQALFGEAAQLAQPELAVVMVRFAHRGSDNRML